MQFHVSKKLGEWLELGELPNPPKERDKLYSWLADFGQFGGVKFIAFVNEASRYTVAAIGPDKNKALAETLFDALRDTLLADNVNPGVIERYFAERGEAKIYRSHGKTESAWLSKATSALESNISDTGDNTPIDNLLIQTFPIQAFYRSGPGSNSTPRQALYTLLERYGMPVILGKAFDLAVRLDLDGNDATRELRVSANISFEQLHVVLQEAFSWNTTHLHSFGMFKKWGKNYCGAPEVELMGRLDEFEPEEDTLSANVKLSDYIPKYKKILYLYDFGDGWHHYIELKNVINDCAEKLPILLSGEGDAPPEDVGAEPGFAEFLRVMADPSHEEHESYKDWADMQCWEPFSFKRAAKAVQRCLAW